MLNVERERGGLGRIATFAITFLMHMCMMTNFANVDVG
jgi:hypothetical protein